MRKLREVDIAMWDLFICHASDDKETAARPLAEALTRAGIRVWYDEFVLTLGDSLRRTIDLGLAQSRYGLVILSPSFFEKQWPQQELDGLSAKAIGGQKTILPIWHRVTRDDVARYSLPLADKVAVSTERGLEYVVQEILRVIHATTSPLYAHFPPFRDIQLKRWQEIVIDERPHPFPPVAATIPPPFPPKSSAEVFYVDGWNIRLRAGGRYRLTSDRGEHQVWPEIEIVLYQRVPRTDLGGGLWKRVVSIGSITSAEPASDVTPSGEDWLITCWGKRVVARDAPWWAFVPGTHNLDTDSATLTLTFSAPYPYDLTGGLPLPPAEADSCSVLRMQAVE
jgi:TIR domain